MKIDNPDEFLIGRADAFMGRVEVRGVTVPKVLKELSSAELMSIALLPALGFIQEGWLIGGLWLIISSLNGLMAWARYTEVKHDADKEWDEGLMKKYLKRAGMYRSAFFFNRVMTLALVVLIVVLTVAQVVSGTAQAFDIAMSMWWLIHMVRMYMDCAVPKPPKRKTQFKPVFGGI